MISEKEYKQIIRIMPFVNKAPKPIKEEFIRFGYPADIPAGRDVFVVGDRANAIALLINGVV